MFRKRKSCRGSLALMCFVSAGLALGPAYVWGQPADGGAGSEDLAEAGPPERPFSLGVTYSILSDYIFRGINLSEHGREGREKLNHQLSTSLDVPLGPDGQDGTLGFDTFFEWYGDQEKISGDGANIQEIDYTLRWSYDLEPIASTVTLGWTAFILPNLDGVSDNDQTHELFVLLEHNDAWMWRWLGYHDEEGVLNPSLFVAYDWHIARGVWIELGVSHEFPIVEDLTVTPGMVFAIDGGYLGPLLGTDDHDFRYAYTQFGVDVTYDLTNVLNLPEWAGAVAVSGQVYYTNVTDSAEQTGIQDEFWGGMAVSWSW